MGVSGRDAKEGCKVIDLTPDLPAKKAGLKVGDIITKIEADKIGSLTELQIMLAKHKPGTEVTVHFLRDGETHSEKVKLVSRNPRP
jgi:S1-C subfamily serine protease